MAELVPASFADLVTRLHAEPQVQGSLFELDRKRWHLPARGAADLSVRFHGRRAGNPLGPAAGPHTQMAQNLLLSYVAGGRILELKTVQANDRLTIPRPCIDMTNVGYNVEWSQELRVEESLREYVAGAMLIEMFRRSAGLSGGALDGPAGDVIFDLSVGYDLAGIRGDKVRGFLDGMRAAGPMVECLRSEVPPEFASARELPFATHLSDSITLSTFHGCPADEIERICEFLIGDGFDVIVKMNPPMLGRERLEHLLHDVLGYRELTVNPAAYESGLAFGEGVELCRRLASYAAARGRSFGAKFSNTLEVLNHRAFFTRDNRVMYLSGQPLHVMTLTLADEFRRAVGPELPISFSAGVDQLNFPTIVACGFVPITVSTDLLRPGGYGRFGAYLERLSAEMRKCGATTMDEFILRRADAAVDRDGDGRGKPPEEAAKPRVAPAGAANTSRAAEHARGDPRYRAEANRKSPTRIESTLETFDCITCDKCLPVCPNAANFTYPTPAVAFEFADLVLEPSGAWRPQGSRRFEIERAMQIACYADFCNECGNCDTFCPEYGGPYIRKPSFFGSEESWRRAAPRDGFVVGGAASAAWIRGRIKGGEYRLLRGGANGDFVYESNAARVRIAANGRDVRDVERLEPGAATLIIDLWPFHVMRYLLAGVLDARRVNQVNAGLVHAAGGS